MPVGSAPRLWAGSGGCGSCSEGQERPGGCWGGGDLTLSSTGVTTTALGGTPWCMWRSSGDRRPPAPSPESPSVAPLHLHQRWEETAGWPGNETLSILQGPGNLASFPRAPVGGHWRTGGTQDVAPHLSPTSLTAHASTRSQTSKNVKHVDARGGGEGERCLSGRWARGLLPPLHPELPHPPPWAGCGGRKGGRGDPAPRP